MFPVLYVFVLSFPFNESKDKSEKRDENALSRKSANIRDFGKSRTFYPIFEAFFPKSRSFCKDFEKSSGNPENFRVSLHIFSGNREKFGKSSGNREMGGIFGAENCS